MSIGDATYIWIGNRWFYLVVVLDSFSQKMIGCVLSSSPDSKLSMKALGIVYDSR